MNIVLCLFHQLGKQKYIISNYKSERVEISPILYIQKDFSIGIQKNDIKKQKGGEADTCIDAYLYGNDLNVGFLINSNNTEQLMNKKLFLRNLNELNKVTSNIAKEFIKEIEYNGLLDLMNEMKCSKYPSKKKIRKKFDLESLNLDCNVLHCDLDVITDCFNNFK